MNEWFDGSSQKKKMLGYLPTGRVYRNAYVDGSNLNKFIEWMSKGFEVLVDEYNRTFMGLFVCESDYLLEKWKTDYGIPNNIFYEHPEENWKDVFVLRYLMRGNKEWNYRAIANIYGVDIFIYRAGEYLKDSRLPHKVPHRIQNVVNGNNAIVISFVNIRDDELDDSEEGVKKKRLLEKIKKIYGVIKEAHLSIVYMPLNYESDITTEQNRIPTYLPAKIGREVKITNLPTGYELPERLEFHLGDKHERFHP